MWTTPGRLRAGLASATTTATVPEPTDPLARASLEALAELRAATAERARLERELLEHLSPAARGRYRAVSDATSDQEGAGIRLHVAELCRHFPWRADRAVAAPERP